MDKLYNFYMRSIKLWATFVAFISYFIATYLAPALPDILSDWIKKVALSTGTLATLFWLGEFVIRRYLWKSFHFLRKYKFYHLEEFDFDGDWHGETFYRSKYTETGMDEKHQNFYKYHEVRIYQDCLRVRVETTSGDIFPRWGSISATVSEDGVLHILYRVEYAANDVLSNLNSPSFPNTLYGYESMSASKRSCESKSRGRPTILYGKFRHCLGEGFPIYYGETIFVRKDAVDMLETSDLPVGTNNGKLGKMLTKVK